MSPLDRFELRGSVSCAHCGLEQALDARAFAHLLDMAHDVVDLAGTDPEVRRPGSPLALDNPYHVVGITVSDRTWVEPGAIGGREALSVRASPGHPLCPRCKAPFAVRLAPDQIVLHCPACNTGETHAWPAPPTTLWPSARALVAPAYRRDLREATATSSRDGTAKISCPHCGAPLHPDLHSTSLTCAHCRAPALISNKLWFRLGVREPHTEPIWVLFAGRSRRRQALEERAADVDPFQRELEARARAVLAGKNLAPPGPAPALHPLTPPGMTPAVPSSPPRRAGSALLVVLIVLALLGLTAAAIAAALLVL